MSTGSQHCEQLKLGPIFTFVGILYAGCWVLGTVENLLLFCSLIQCKFLPVNVRFLLGNMTLGILFMSVLSTWNHVHKFGAIFSGHLVEVSYLFCVADRLQAVLNAAVIVISLGSLEFPKPKTLVLLLVVMVFYIFIEVSSVLLYLHVWHLNTTRLADFSINTAHHSLQERFEIRQNIKVTQMMLPVVILHAICWLTVLLAVIPKSIWYVPEDLVSQEIGLMALLSPLRVYEVLYPLLIFWRSEHLRRAVKGMFLCQNQVYPMVNDATLTYGDKQPKDKDDETPGEDGGQQDLRQPPVEVPRNLGKSGWGPPLPREKVAGWKKVRMEFKIGADANAKILEQIWNTGKGPVPAEVSQFKLFKD